MGSSTLHRYDLSNLKCVRSYYFNDVNDRPFSHADVTGDLIQTIRSLTKDDRGYEIMHFDVGQSFEDIFSKQDRGYLYYDHHGYGREHLHGMPKEEIRAGHSSIWTPFAEEIALSLFVETFEEAREWVLRRCAGRFWEEPNFSWLRLQDELNSDLHGTVGWRTEGVPYKL